MTDAQELKEVAQNLNDKNLQKFWMNKIEKFSDECQNLRKSIKVNF